MTTFKVAINKIGSDDLFDTYIVNANSEYQAWSDAVDRFQREYPNEDSDFFEFKSLIK